MADCSPTAVRALLAEADEPTKRIQVAAALSKVAAKAEDDVLILLSEKSNTFVAWLVERDCDDPLVRAYAACILANIAFLEDGQQRVLDAHGVAPLVQMLKTREDKKVTLHSTAAVQNLTYKNTVACQEVINEGGERALKKLLQHKSEDVQQFAAGALANLQLYRRKEEVGSQPSKSKDNLVTRKLAKILGRNKPAASSSHLTGAAPSHDYHADEAAAAIQACARGLLQRNRFKQRRKELPNMGRTTTKYTNFSIHDVRAELSVVDAGRANFSQPYQTGDRLSGLLRPAAHMQRPRQLEPLRPNNLRPNNTLPPLPSLGEHPLPLGQGGGLAPLGRLPQQPRHTSMPAGPRSHALR